MRKPGFCILENKGTDQFAVTFVFVTRIVQCIYSKFPVYNNLLWLHVSDLVGNPKDHFFLTMRLIARYVSDLVGNPKDQFSHNEAHIRTVLLKM